MRRGTTLGRGEHKVGSPRGSERRSKIMTKTEGPCEQAGLEVEEQVRSRNWPNGLHDVGDICEGEATR
jgi:hypothetical protein